MADEPLIQRDPAVIGLRVAMDPAAVLDRLSALRPHHRFLRLHPYYIRYKPGTNCLVGYKAETDDGRPTWLYVTAFSRETQKIPDLAAVDSSTNASDIGVLHDAANHLMIRVYPDDRELQVVRFLNDAEYRGRSMFKWLGLDVDARGAEFKVVRYKPERRLVLHCPINAIALKFYADDNYERARENASFMKRRKNVVSATLLGRNLRRRVLAYRWITGATLADQEATDVVLANVGRALARLHATKKQPPYRASMPSLVEAAEAVNSLAPWLAHRATALAQSLAFTETSEAATLIHGDMSHEQIIVNGDEITMLDFDRAGLGDPRSDIGRYIAKLRLRSFSTPQSITDETQLEWLLSGYLDQPHPETVTADNWRPFAAAEMLRLAVEPFRVRHHEWPQLMDRIIAVAEQWSDHAR